MFVAAVDGLLALGCGTADHSASKSISGSLLERRSSSGSWCGPLAAVSTRPRISLVLGGGGLRGYAHIGVLQALEDAGTRVAAQTCLLARQEADSVDVLIPRQSNLRESTTLKGAKPHGSWAIRPLLKNYRSSGRR
jgi:hypothetical protein